MEGYNVTNSKGPSQLVQYLDINSSINCSTPFRFFAKQKISLVGFSSPSPKMCHSLKSTSSGLSLYMMTAIPLQL